MNKKANLRSGGQILIDGLIAQGTDIVFQVPGESFLPVLDALHDTADRIRVITCRHESGAANMAEAHGNLTGRPGICFVTRGPGAGHAAVGVLTAKQDSSPMILFVGQVDRPFRGREAFQEVDLAAMFGWTAKWVTEVDDPAKLPAVITRAFEAATEGRPGPVVIGLPEDMLDESADVEDAARISPAATKPAAHDVSRAAAIVREATRPLVIAGGTGWSEAACENLRDIATAWNLPVCVSFRRQDRFDNTHANYVGDLAFAMDPGLADGLASADVILALGTRLGDLATKGYSVIRPPHPDQTLVHVYPDASELGRVFEPDLAIHACVAPFVAAWHALCASDSRGWTAWTDRLRAAYARTQEPGVCPGGVDLNDVIAVVRQALPPDAIVATDAGNFSQWVQRYYPFRQLGTQVAPPSGAMGYGVPAGIAAKVIHPARQVVVFVGDGGFLMTGNELATAVQHDVGVIVIVVNNAMFGTIRAHQERRYPGRVSGTGLKNPDLTALGKSFGVHATRVTRTAEFAPVFKAALAAKGPSLIEVVIDPEAISPTATLSQIRNAALAAHKARP